MPATSAPAERVFSLSGIILVKRRCSLRPEFVNALVFLHRNARLLRLLNDDPVRVLPLQPLFTPPSEVVDASEDPQLPQLYDAAVHSDGDVEVLSGSDHEEDCATD